MTAVAELLLVAAQQVACVAGTHFRLNRTPALSTNHALGRAQSSRSPVPTDLLGYQDQTNQGIAAAALPPWSKPPAPMPAHPPSSLPSAPPAPPPSSHVTTIRHLRQLHLAEVEAATVAPPGVLTSPSARSPMDEIFVKYDRELSQHEVEQQKFFSLRAGALSPSSHPTRCRHLSEHLSPLATTRPRNVWRRGLRG